MLSGPEGSRRRPPRPHEPHAEAPGLGGGSLLRLARGRDALPISALFAAAARATPHSSFAGGQVFPGDREEWRWCREGSPAGTREWIVAAGDDVVAHASLLRHHVRIAGEEHRFSQVLDVCVHPKLSRDAGVADLVRDLARQLCTGARPPEGDRVLFDWARGAERCRIAHESGFDLVRTQSLLELDLRVPCVAAREPDPSGIAGIQRFGAEAARLFERCSADFGASIVRDAEFLNWRFHDRPGRAYEAVAAREEGGPWLGYAVVHASPAHVPSSLAVVDWLVPADELEVGRRLHHALLVRARRQGARRLLATLPEWSPWFARFQEWGHRVSPSDEALFAKGSRSSHDALWLRDAWWYQWADGPFP